MTKFRTDDDPPIVHVPSADAEMNAAIAHARDTLPTFWASCDAPKPTEVGHALKVRFDVGDEVEHIWVSDVEKLSDGNYSGRFANEPSDLIGKNIGDQVKFKQADISDWMFMRNEKIVGGETIKVVLESMPKEEADAVRARMEQP
ncbi:MAG TPA: DUF2314 domain-containing protein [Bradyrhizobium sp.]|jgi:uncharacterized protein YegJ (DUF2314 family)|nr:DUF2314 domain-containing protein [Bradyrhizobium sp.]